MTRFCVISIFFLSTLAESLSQPAGCTFPSKIEDSRDNRLHHPCERNQHPLFAIETHAEAGFYCVFYSSLETTTFQLRDRVELTVVGGEFNFEEANAEDVTVNATRLSFTVSLEDVTIKVSRASRDMPQISSVLVNGEELCEQCGTRSDAIPIIVGGGGVREGAWPWHAAVYHRPTTGVLRFRCGSTVVNRRTVITVATCLVTHDASLGRRVPFAAETVSVGIGETVLYDTSSAIRRMMQIERIKLHEMFGVEHSTTRFVDDFNVALLILRDTIDYSLHVQPICLPPYTADEFSYDGRHGTVVGWGFTENGGLDISSRLQELSVPTHNLLTCMFQSEDRVLFQGFSAKRNFCAGFARDKGICTGDSGGGLYMKEDSKFFIYGMASHTNCECNPKTGKCIIRSEGIFLNLVAFNQWIHNNVF